MEENTAATAATVAVDNDDDHPFFVLDRKKPDHLIINASKFETEKVFSLLRGGADVDQMDEDGCTALHRACRNDHFPIIRILTAYEADVNIESLHGHTPLQLLCMFSRNREMMDFLVRRGADVGKPTVNGDNILHLATRADNFEGMKFALDNNIDINSKGMHNNTPLHIAAGKSHNPAVLEFLLDHSNLQATNGEGSLFLHIAAMSGNKEAIEAGLKHGMDINEKIKGKLCSTPLLAAARVKDRGFLDFLVSKGADIHSKNCQNNSLIHRAVIYENFEGIQFALDHSADINQRGSGGCTPILIAAVYTSGTSGILQTLVDKGKVDFR